MPKELLEIKNFTLGTQTTPSETDISHEAASFSLNVDPIAQDGKLQAVPDDDTKNGSFGSALMMKTIIDGDDSGQRTIIAYTGDNNGNGDGTISYAHDIENASTPALSALTSAITDNAYNLKALDMEVNNKEVHIGLGTVNSSKNDPKWVGKIDHKQFGVDYSSTNNGFYVTDAELKAPDEFKACYKLIVVKESDGTYIYGIEWKGNRVYRFKEDTAGTTYSFVGSSLTRFESTQGICIRYNGGQGSMASPTVPDPDVLKVGATLWVYDANVGDAGTLYAYNPRDDKNELTFGVSADSFDLADSSHTKISDISEREMDTNDFQIFFSKYYDNEYPVKSTDYYSGNTGTVSASYGDEQGVGLIYTSKEPCFNYDGSNGHASSKIITLTGRTPLLMNPRTGYSNHVISSSDYVVSSDVPFYAGAGTRKRVISNTPDDCAGGVWVYQEDYTTNSSDKKKDGQYLGGITGNSKEDDDLIDTRTTLIDGAVERFICYGDQGEIMAVDYALQAYNESGSTTRSNYANTCLRWGILDYFTVLNSDGTAYNAYSPYDETKYGISSAGNAAFSSYKMNNNCDIDTTNKIIWTLSRSAPGHNSKYSYIGAVSYATNAVSAKDSKGTGISDDVAISMAQIDFDSGTANSQAAIYEEGGTNAKDYKYGAGLRAVRCHPNVSGDTNLLVVLRAKMHAASDYNIKLYTYSNDGATVSAVAGADAEITHAELSDDVGGGQADKLCSTPMDIILDKTRNVAISIGAWMGRFRGGGSTDSNYACIGVFNYSASSIIKIEDYAFKRQIPLCWNYDETSGTLAQVLLIDDYTAWGTATQNGWAVHLTKFNFVGTTGAYQIEPEFQWVDYQDVNSTLIPQDIHYDSTNGLIHISCKNSTKYGSYSTDTVTVNSATGGPGPEQFHDTEGGDYAFSEHVTHNFNATVSSDPNRITITSGNFNASTDFTTGTYVWGAGIPHGTYVVGNSSDDADASSATWVDLSKDLPADLSNVPVYATTTALEGFATASNGETGTTKRFCSSGGGNTVVTLSVNSVGTVEGEIQRYSHTSGTHPSENHGQMTITSDGKYMFMGGTEDARNIRFVKRNINNKNAIGDAPTKNIFTHSIVHFAGGSASNIAENTGPASGTLMGKVLVDEELGLCFSQNIDDNSMLAFKYWTDDDCKITTPKVNLASNSDGQSSAYRRMSFAFKFNHPLLTSCAMDDNNNWFSRWWIFSLGIKFEGSNIADTGTIGALTGGTFDAYNGTKNSQYPGNLIRLQWTDGATDFQYDPDFYYFGNVTNEGGNQIEYQSLNHWTMGFVKNANESYFQTLQKNDTQGVDIGDWHSLAFTLNDDDANDNNYEINQGEFSIPKLVMALRTTETTVNSNMDDSDDMYGFGISSDSGAPLTLALKREDGANINTSASYTLSDVSDSDASMSEGPASSVYISNPTVLALGGTLKHNYKYFYKLSFIYDGYQEGPLGDDTQVKTIYATADSSTVLTDNLVSIKFNIDIPNHADLNKRITAVRVYRAESSDSSSDSPEGFYRLVKELDLKSLWSSYTPTGSSPSFSEQKRASILDTGASFQNYEASTGISEVIDSFHVRYTCSTQLNNTHFIGNLSSNLSSSILGSNYIAKSKPYNFNQYDLLKDVLSLPDTPLALHAFQGRIYAFCENNTYKIEPNNLFIEDTWEGVGTFNQQSVYSNDYGMCWCDKNNIYLFDGRVVKNIGDTILKGDSTNSWQEGSLEFDDINEEPRVFFDSKRKAFMIQFTCNLDHRKIWAYSILKSRWDLWDIGDNTVATCWAHGPAGENYYVAGTNLISFLGTTGTGRKALSWHSKKLTMGMDTQIKLFKKVRLTGTESSGSPMDGTVSGLTIETGGGSLSGDEITHSDDGEQALYSLSGSKAKSEWLKFKLDANAEDALTIDAIGVVYRRRPIR